MRWMNTSRKQARVRGCSARRICSIRAEALESVRRNSTFNPFPTSIVVVKQYESKLLHRALSNSAPFGVRRVLQLSKVIFRHVFSKYNLILWDRFSKTNRAWGGDSEWGSAKNPWTVGAALAHRGLIREVRVLRLMIELGVLGSCRSICVSTKEGSAGTVQPR